MLRVEASVVEATVGTEDGQTARDSVHHSLPERQGKPAINLIFHAYPPDPFCPLTTEPTHTGIVPKTPYYKPPHPIEITHPAILRHC